MRNLVLALLVVLMGLGCCKPISVPTPPPAVVPEPMLHVTALTENSTWTDISAAYKIDLAEWVAYGRHLEILIWGKTTPPAPAAPENK